MEVIRTNENTLRLIFSGDGEWMVYWDENPDRLEQKKHYLGKFTGTEAVLIDPNPNRRIYFLALGEVTEIAAERKVNIKGAFNFRDLGGLETVEGKKVKWGILFRSDALSGLSADDITYVEAMRIRTIADFRNDEERDHRPNKRIDGSNTVLLNPNAKTAALAGKITDEEKVRELERLSETEEGRASMIKDKNTMTGQMIELAEDEYAIARYRELVLLLSDSSNLPLVQHCYGGKDRTGFGVALILLALGVKEEVMKDYLLTGQMNAKRNFHRYGDRVKYWILVNQINLIVFESFNHLGIAADASGNLLEAKCQGVHNEMVACAKATKLAREINPNMQIGMMLYDDLSYAASSKPEDVLATYRRNQMQYFPADVLLRGKYPGYAYRFFDEKGITVHFGENDEEDLKHTADFLALSYYYVNVSDSESVKRGNGSYQNPFVESSDWGWGIDAIGLRTHLNMY